MIGAVLAGVAIGGGIVAAVDRDTPTAAATRVGEDPWRTTVPFHGAHQAGIATPTQASATLLAFDLRPDVDRAAIGRLLRLWTADAATLASGSPIIGDSAPGLAADPAGLTITVALGFGAFAQVDAVDRWPLAIREIPPYRIDDLQERWSDGDLLLQIAGDDPVSVYHAAHELTRDAVPFATVRWQQRGFNGPADIAQGEIGRNLLGQVDGIANPAPDSPAFAEQTWATTPAAMRGGTTMVVRRIRFDLETWDLLSETKKERVVGRDVEEGAPLSGGTQTTPMDFAATEPDGDPLVPKSAHAQRAATKPGEGITRRGYNYDDGYTARGERDAGLVFVSFQRTIEQYLAIQAALAEIDTLNLWATPIGSALFIVPPGAEPGDWIGEALLG